MTPLELGIRDDNYACFSVRGITVCLTVWEMTLAHHRHAHSARSQAMQKGLAIMIEHGDGVTWKGGARFGRQTAAPCFFFRLFLVDFGGI
jgi:hypothetical protein